MRAVHATADVGFDCQTTGLLLVILDRGARTRFGNRGLEYLFHGPLRDRPFVFCSKYSA